MGKILSFFGGPWLYPAILVVCVSIVTGVGGYIYALKGELKTAISVGNLLQIELNKCLDSAEEQNQRIEMFKEEARIMGENLKKHRDKAASDRLRGDKRARAIMIAPSELTCQAAVGKAVEGIQLRFKDE